MDIFLEKLTLGNLTPALFWSLTGRRVQYFELGRALRKLPFLGLLWRGMVHKSEYQIAEPVGLGYRIHWLALEAAESIYLRLVAGDGAALNSVCRNFRSEKVRTYVKKYLVIESWPLCRDYLVLQQRFCDGANPVRLVVQDTPLSRHLVPFLKANRPGGGVVVAGLSRAPWRVIQDPVTVLVTAVESLARLTMFFLRRGLTFRRKKITSKIAKELIWGIGVNTGRRNDDFMVDSQQLQPSDVLLYYRRSAAARMGNPAYLSESIQNCHSRGYQCVNFDRVSVPLAWGIKHILPRHILLPARLSLSATLKSFYHPEAALMHQVLGNFISQARGWEVMLGSYSPELNISQDDPYPSHIADTVAMNLHGSLNGGFQWSDMTTYRSATLAYLSYNIYLAWGTLPSDFWQDNWGINQVLVTGYPWGHFFQDSLAEQESLKDKLLGEGTKGRLVVSMFDEKPDPDVYQSEEMLYDFYSIGTKLLDQRNDIIVVVKPKRFEGIPPVQRVLDLISPYVQSGRMIIWDRMQVDLWQVLAVSDAAVSMVMGTPHLEAVCCGIPGFSYAPTKNESSPIYSQGLGTVVFDKVEPLVDSIGRVLNNPDVNPWDRLPELTSGIDPYRDYRGIDRMRESILAAADGRQQVAFTESAAVSTVGR